MKNGENKWIGPMMTMWFIFAAAVMACAVILGLVGCTYTRVERPDGLRYTAIGAPLVARDQAVKITKTTVSHNTKEDVGDQMELLKSLLEIAGAMQAAQKAAPVVVQ